jgi:hypothetical protein
MIEATVLLKIKYNTSDSESEIKAILELAVQYLANQGLLTDDYSPCEIEDWNYIITTKEVSCD